MVVDCSAPGNGECMAMAMAMAGLESRCIPIAMDPSIQLATRLQGTNAKGEGSTSIDNLERKGTEE